MHCTYIFCKDNTKSEQNQTIRRMIYAASQNIIRNTPLGIFLQKQNFSKLFNKKTSKKFVSMKRTS